jgi:hypothetical protein
MTSVEKFSFKLDGCPVSAAVHKGERSFLSFACAEHLHLRPSGGGYNGGLFVLMADSWATCVMSFRMSAASSEMELCLGLDWQAQIKDLCTGTGIALPSDLVSFFRVRYQSR